MFHIIKDFVIGFLVTVGIVSSPVALPTQKIQTPEPEIITQQQEIQTTESVVEPVKKQTQNEPQKPLQSVSVSKTIDIPTGKNTTEEEEIPIITVEKENGQCGNNNNKNLESIPTDKLCVQGTPSIVTEDRSDFKWNCLGSGGGRDVKCYANKKQDGVCGSLANTIIPTNYNKDNLCSIGNSSNIQTIGNQLQWSCNGEYSGSSVSCYATKALTQADIQNQQTTITIKEDGICGYAQNQTYSQIPTYGLCSKGTATTVTKTGATYKWACQNSGSPAQCTATYKEEVCVPTSIFIYGKGMVTTPCPTN